MSMVEVVGTNEFEDWFLALEDADARAVTRAIDRLAEAGVALGHPYASEIKGTKQPLRELRIQSQGRPLRVFYAFDPKRQAAVLIGGDKTGDDRFYKIYIPKAEAIWKRHRAAIEAELEAERRKKESRT
jgi:hypothetical protein